MKTYRNLLLLALLGLSQVLNAQVFDPAAPIGADVGRSVLGVVMGSHPRLGTMGMEKALMDWEKAPASIEKAYAVAVLQRSANVKLERLDHPLTDSSAGNLELLAEAEGRTLGHYCEGIVQTIDGKYSLAVRSFNASELNGSLDPESRLPYFKTIAQYLEKYGDDTPLFKGFNGGFYSFACDSLQWRFKKPDSTDYHRMLRSLLDLSALTGQQSVYFELMGDLLVHHPDVVKANWFGCLSYFRSAFDIPQAKAIFEEKAIYALEAPQKAANRFDNYQFNRLRMRLQSDMDSVAVMRAEYEAGEKAAVAAGESASAFLEGELGKRAAVVEYGAGDATVTYIHEDAPGNLPGIIREADRRHAESMGEERKFAGEVDLKGVKSETTFNIYGIAMILVVVGAVIFFWLKLTRGRKQES